MSMWRLPIAVTVVAVLAVVASVMVLGRHTETERPVVTVSQGALESSTDGSRSRTQGLEILREWDQARALAWAAGDQRRLSALYTPGSASGARDVAMLRRWLARGLVVESMQTQVRGATVVARNGRRMVITVTDRLVGAVAVGANGQRPLPADRWSTRRVILKRIGGQWVVAEVRANAVRS